MVASKKENKKNLLIGIGAIGLVAIAIGAATSEKYYIDIEDHFTFDCNAVYDETNNAIKCTEQSVDGNYSAKDSIKLMSNEIELTSSDGHFSKIITSPTIPASEFETDTYVTILTLEKKYGETKEQFILLENDEQKLSKEITVKWNITSDDKKLFDDKQNEWKKKASEQRSLVQEATTDTTKINPSETTTSTPAVNTQQDSGNNSSNSSPNSGVDYIVEGYCNDGTLVKGDPSAKGKANACYGHDGWRDY